MSLQTNNEVSIQDKKIAVIGLGYVGLPLALEFSKQFNTIGFDINEGRINELQSGTDSTLEVTEEELTEALQNIRFSANSDDLAEANFYIVTVPTPVTDSKQPDLTPLDKASQMIAPYLKKGDIVVYESTVYPGCTEEFCIPILEKCSGLTFNEDFYAGYSPERINPGDSEHKLPTIMKVTSGSTDEIAQVVNAVYASIITAGTHLASSSKVAEAAKVIENTQRDINIALINELAMIFNKMNIDTLEVLQAAGTKWNFLPFRPGLVGGHCIGVDPYYLTHKAQMLGFNPQMILSGRRINDGMSDFIVDQLIMQMTKQKIHVVDSNVLILGLTFKENCPDIRNTKVIDIVTQLKKYNANVDVHDPWADAEEVKQEYDIHLTPKLKANHYDAVILCVSHDAYKVEMSAQDIRTLGKEKHIFFDAKSAFKKSESDIRL